MTFIVVEIDGDGINIIAHVKHTDDAIRIQQDMSNNNPDRKFVWMMLGKAK